MLAVAALSGRAIGVAARRAGATPVIMDLFGDRETRSVALDSHIIAGDPVCGFDADGLLRAFDHEDSRWPLIYGSGFESRPDLLDIISQERPVFGNTAAVVAQVTQPEAFFDALRCLNLPAPPIFRLPPKNEQHWLRKQAGSAGGMAVMPFQGKTTPGTGSTRSKIYYQKRQSGHPYSVQFITKGDQTDIVCFCRNWLAPTTEHPYRFGGLSTKPNLTRDLQTRLADAAAQLSAYFSLRGLNSLDVLIDRESFSILEINPRPGAAIDILENMAPGWSIPAHMAACQGQLWPRWPGISTHDISLTLCYADQDCSIPSDVDWPSYCVDTPHGPKMIASGQPICSIQSIGDDQISSRQLGIRRSKYVKNKYTHSNLSDKI